MKNKEIWIFIFSTGVMFFTWPIMGIFKERLIPYLFAVWLSFIFIVGITSIFSDRDGGRS